MTVVSSRGSFPKEHDHESPCVGVGARRRHVRRPGGFGSGVRQGQAGGGAGRVGTNVGKTRTLRNASPKAKTGAFGQGGYPVLDQRTTGGGSLQISRDR